MKIILEYIWLDGDNNLRGKTKVWDGEKDFKVSDLPEWNYDGSSTKQAIGNDSEVILKPRKIYPNPFVPNNRYDSHIVLCDTWKPDCTPHPSNTRVIAETIFQLKPELKPWFGIEQEFFFINPKLNLPIGFRIDGGAPPQGPYYCGVGGPVAYGRCAGEEALYNCLNTNLNITGLNFEVAPGQCELQLREEGLDAGDDLIMLRYILIRTGEKYGLGIDFSAKPIKGDWNGSGCHVNFSTQPMREDDGYKEIENAIKKLSEKHQEHIKVYGDDNNERLTGLHETSSMDKFTFGVADRTASIRVPRETISNKKGYFEDRRPSSSMDPYLVISKIFETTSL